MMGNGFFDPTGTTGPNGYLNYKMSGGDNGGNSNGPGCGVWIGIMIVLFVLEIIAKL